MAWERLDHVVLSGTSDTLNSGTFTAKKNLKVMIYTTIGSGTPELKIKFNGDTSSDYANRYTQNGASDSTSASSSNGIIGISAIPQNTLTTLNITNIADKEKILIMESVNQNTAGAGNAPSREECVAKWANTSNQITSIQISSGTGGDWGTGSYITVLGAKESSQSQEITVDSLATKKYLWVQAKLIPTSALDGSLRFNGDSGSNYATRDSRNGANNADASTTGFNLTAGHSPSQPYFVTYYIINEAGKEKLAVGEMV